jgi:hypothetical protein
MKDMNDCKKMPMGWFARGLATESVNTVLRNHQIGGEVDFS